MVIDEEKIDYDLLSDYSIVDNFFLKVLRPPEKLLVSEWSDKYRMLSRKSSAEAGQWRTSRAPYLKEVMDALSEDSVYNEVIVMKGAQIGFSEAGFNWLGYIIDHAPGPTLMLMPTTDTAKRNVKMRIEPMIEETPQLLKKVGESKAKDKDNTTMLKSFPGGLLIISGANSAASIRSMPIKNIMFDEEDGYPKDLDGEGSPISLGMARTRTFGSKKKVFRISTPTYEDTSTIAVAYENSSKAKYLVPCPHCDHKQEIIWENLKWEDEDTDTVLLFCTDCGEGIEEHYKTQMLTEGHWEHEFPENESRGYHLSSLYSPLGWYSWKDAAKEFVKAKGNNEKMKTFHNTVLGRTWKEKGDAPSWKRIFKRRESYKIGEIPVAPHFLTMAVDVQKNRLELEVVAWLSGGENYSITYEIIEGDTSSDEVWSKLDFYVQKQYNLKDSDQEYPIALTAIDSGYNTQMVYAFCRKYPRSRVIPVKGRSKASVAVQIPKAVDIRKSGKTKRLGMRVWTIGIDILKSEIYGALNQEEPLDAASPLPVGWYHFPEYDEEYFKMLTAEQLVKKKNNKGFFVYEWQKIRDRNEALDLKVYNKAAAIIMGINKLTDADLEKRNRLSQGIAKPPEIKAKTKNKELKKKKKRDSSYW